MDTQEPACAICSRDRGLRAAHVDTEIVVSACEKRADAVMTGASDQVEYVWEADADG